MESKIGQTGRKTLGATIELKHDDDSPTGEFKARIATLGVKDLDGDVIMPGAFGKSGQAVKVAAFGHNWQQPPVGKGKVYEKGMEAFVDGQYFLDMESAQENYKAVRNLGEDGEWSFGFRITDGDWGKDADADTFFIKKMQVFEASPVMKGASIDTATIEAKTMKDEKFPTADEIGEAVAKHLGDKLKEQVAVTPPPTADEIAKATVALLEERAAAEAAEKEAAAEKETAPEPPATNVDEEQRKSDTAHGLKLMRMMNGV